MVAVAAPRPCTTPRRAPRATLLTPRLAALPASAALGTPAPSPPPGSLDVGRSVKTLALQLKPLLQPGDEVMTYETYYQDLPFYLERRVTVVGWKGELEFGTTVEDTRGWMIDAQDLPRRWNAAHSVYLL